MNSYRADRLARQHYPVPSTDIWNDFLTFDQNQSQYSNTLDLPQNWNLEASQNSVNFGDRHLAGLSCTSWPVSQPAKRLRSDSDEASVSRLSQVQALLAMANSDVVEKIWQFLSGMCQLSLPNEVNGAFFFTVTDVQLDTVALSSTKGPGIVHSLYPAELQSNHTAMMGIPDPSPTALSAILPPSDLVTSENFGLYQDCMQPMNSVDDINVNAAIESTTNIFRISPNHETTTQLSMPIQKAAHRTQLPPHSHSSNLSLCLDTSAAAEAARQLRQGLIVRKKNRNRDSVLSISSYNSTDTEMSVNTKHSSMTSLGSQSSRSSRKCFPQRFSVSSVSAKKSYRRSSSLGVVSNPPSEILCTYPHCSSTFTREPDRARHEASIHSTDAGYTCLFHTCAMSCSDDCENTEHSVPYQNARPDKMKKHLEKAHNWSVKQGDIPKPFLKPYDRQQRGWKCGVCSINLGSWHDNKRQIEAHSENCTEGLQTSFRRMSIEEPGKQGLWITGNAATDKTLPETPLETDDDEYWTTDVLD